MEEIIVFGRGTELVGAAAAACQPKTVVVREEVPVTQIVSLAVAWIYVAMHPEMPRTEAYAGAAAILVLFQITPISPGSLVRGLYVLYLVIKERNFKDYNIAFTLSFFKYIGYLAFPIQMAYRYPDLARFMADGKKTQLKLE